MAGNANKARVFLSMLSFVLVSAVFATIETSEGSNQRPQIVGEGWTTEYATANAIDDSTLKQPKNDRLTRRTPPAVFAIPDEGLHHLIDPDFRSLYINRTNAYWMRIMDMNDFSYKHLELVRHPKKKEPQWGDVMSRGRMFPNTASQDPRYVVDYYVPPELLVIYAASTIDPRSDSPAEMQAIRDFKTAALQRRNSSQIPAVAELRKALNVQSNAVGVDGELYIMKRQTLETEGNMPFEDLGPDLVRATGDYMQKLRSGVLREAERMVGPINRLFPTGKKTRAEDRLGWRFHEFAIELFEKSYRGLEASMANSTTNATARAPAAPSRTRDSPITIPKMPPELEKEYRRLGMSGLEWVDFVNTLRRSPIVAAGDLVTLFQRGTPAATVLRIAASLKDIGLPDLAANVVRNTIMHELTQMKQPRPSGSTSASTSMPQISA